MLNELQWPTLEAQRDQSSLLFSHKIHCGSMSIDKDKYLIPSQSIGVLRRLHTKLWYALNWSMQHPFEALIVKLRFNKWGRNRGWQPAGPAGGGATLVVLVKC